jgi:hypothetical protein
MLHVNNYLADQPDRASNLPRNSGQKHQGRDEGKKGGTCERICNMRPTFTNILQKTLFGWQKQNLSADMQEVFDTKAFLWGLVVAWFNLDKTGNEEFLEGQRRAMESFDTKKGVTKTAMAAAGTPGKAVAGRSATAAVGKAAVAGIDDPAHTIVIRKQKPSAEKMAVLNSAQASALAPPPPPPAAKMPAQPKASGSRHQVPAPR